MTFGAAEQAPASSMKTASAGAASNGMVKKCVSQKPMLNFKKTTWLKCPHRLKVKADLGTANNTRPKCERQL